MAAIRLLRTTLVKIRLGLPGATGAHVQWSERLKYYWLIFGDAPRFNYADHYLSTEGNLLKGAVR